MTDEAVSVSIWVQGIAIRWTTVVARYVPYELIIGHVNHSTGYKAADPNIIPDTTPSSVEDDEDDF